MQNTRRPSVIFRGEHRSFLQLGLVLESVGLPWGSKYHMTPGLVRCKREFQPLHLHIIWIIPVKFCYNMTKKNFLKTKQYPMTSFTDLHISDLIKKLYIFHASYLTFHLQTDIPALARMISVYLIIPPATKL